MGQLVDILYLNRLEKGRAPLKQTPPPGGPSGPDYWCFNCNKAGHWACKCPKPKANMWARTKICKFHRTSTHDDSKCKHMVKETPPPVLSLSLASEKVIVHIQNLWPKRLVVHPCDIALQGANKLAIMTLGVTKLNF